MSERDTTYYQSDVLNRFSPRPGNREGSYDLETIVHYYLENYSEFRFILVLNNGVTLSVCGEENSHYLEIGQLLEGKLMMNPIFNHDGWGVTTLMIEDLQEFIDGVRSTANILG